MFCRYYFFGALTLGRSPPATSGVQVRESIPRGCRRAGAPLGPCEGPVAARQVTVGSVLCPGKVAWRKAARADANWPGALHPAYGAWGAGRHPPPVLHKVG